MIGPRIDSGGDVLMTATARVFRNFVIEAGDLNRVGISAAGEIKGVPETVIGFYRVFADDIVRRVAIVAGGDGVMAGLQPGIVLRPHHMAVGAGLGIVREIGITLGIDEGIGAKAEGQAQQGGSDDRQCGGRAQVWASETFRLRGEQTAECDLRHSTNCRSSRR